MNTKYNPSKSVRPEPFSTNNETAESWKVKDEVLEEQNVEPVEPRCIYSSKEVFKILASASEGRTGERRENLNGGGERRWTYLAMYWRSVRLITYERYEWQTK